MRSQVQSPHRNDAREVPLGAGVDGFPNWAQEGRFKRLTCQARTFEVNGEQHQESYLDTKEEVL